MTDTRTIGQHYDDIITELKREPAQPSLLSRLFDVTGINYGARAIDLPEWMRTDPNWQPGRWHLGVAAICHEAIQEITKKDVEIQSLEFTLMGVMIAGGCTIVALVGVIVVMAAQ